MALAVIGGCRPTVLGAVGFRCSEPEGDTTDVFDNPVVAFAAAVGQSGLDRENHWLLPGFDCFGEPGDLGH